MRISNDLKHADKLRLAGLRITKSRRAVLEAIENDRSHPTAEELHKSIRKTYPSISLSTVYATLEKFIERGLIVRLTSLHGKLRVTAASLKHDHAICCGCGVIFDVPKDLFDRPQTPLEFPSGIKVVSSRVEYVVICPSCDD